MFAFEFNTIYMTNEIYLIGGVGDEITLQNTIEKVNATDKTLPLTVNIHSQGGSVFEGLAIYNYLKGLDQEVNTHSSGLVASIASVIFLAGKNRTINSTDNFLIHLPSNISMGNAVDLEKTASELRSIETKLVDIYVNETNVTKEEAIDLMTKEQFLDVEFLKDKGFVNEIIKFKAVATIDSNFNNDNKNMSEQLTKEGAENLFTKFFNKYFPKEKAPSNKIVQDANGTEIDFPDVAEDLQPVVGDKATIDGSNADGSYVMPSGNTYVFVGGLLDAITEAEEPTPPNEEMENLLKEVETLKETNETLTNSITEKETEITGLKESFDTIKNDFTELKNTVTSNFEVDTKTKQPKKEITKKESRTNFTNKK